MTMPDSAGPIMEAGAPGGRVYNTSVLLGPEGQPLAVYRKIHLFDAEVGDGISYRESDTVAPGEAAVTAETPLGRVGLSICYAIVAAHQGRIEVDSAPGRGARFRVHLPVVAAA